MDELVEDHDVVLPDKRTDGAERGGVATGEGERGLRALEGGERLLQLVMRRE